MSKKLSFSPFDYQEIRELFSQLLNSLLDESGRGAVLISTAHVEDYLSKMIEELLPKNDRNYTNKLLKYPGHLSSFSSKIELAFAFRLISENLYNSLNALRKIRNDAAHSPDSFSLVDLREKMNNVYNLGPFIPNHVRNESLKIMMEIKLKGLVKLFEDYQLSNEEKAKEITKIKTDSEMRKKLEEQLPHWELVYGISFICGLLIWEKEKTIKVLDQNKTWSQISKCL